MKAVMEQAPVESLPDFTYDPVIVKVYRWLQGMEDALNRREARAHEPYEA